MLTVWFALAFLQQQPDAALKTLLKEYQAAESEFLRPWSEAKTDAQREKVKIDWEKHPAAAYARKVQLLARRHEGTEFAGRALLEAFRLWNGAFGPLSDDVRDVVEELMTHHIGSPIMKDFASDLQYDYDRIGLKLAKKSLRAIIKESPHAAPRASATFSLAVILMEGPKAKRAKPLLESLKKDYGKTRYARLADGYLFELEHLRVGMEAPDFEAADSNGEKFKLSDYRGKVVVVDFWGFW